MNDSTVKDLDQLFIEAKSGRTQLIPEWYMNLSYYVGKQWVGWNGNTLYQPKLRRDRIMLVDNRIQPIVRTEVAKLTKHRPTFTVSPTTADEQDSNAAELGELLMKYLWKHLNMQEITFKALLWSRICGAGFLKTFWDPTLGEGTDAVVGPGGKVLTGAEGRPLRAKDVGDPDEMAQTLGLEKGSIQKKTVNQGDIRVEARSPFQMFPDPLADTFDEAEWVIEESVKSPGYILARYGRDVPADTVANPGLIEMRLGGFIPGGGSYKGVKVYEYWCKPNVDHPHGRRAVWTKDRMLAEDDKPFDPFPYVMLSSIPVPGRLWPTSIVEQLRGPQTELNKVKSQIAENRNRVGNPTILASKQSVQDPDKFAQATTMPGGIYFFDDLGSPNAVPSYLQAPVLPPYVVEEIQRIEESIQEISGQHEVTSANVPPGVTAASAINLLQETDDTRLGPSVTDYENQLGKIGQKILKLAAHYYTDSRTVRIGGDNGIWQIFDFRGAMLRSNTHVEVQAGSAFPQSKAAKQAAMQDLLNYMVQSGNPIHGRQLAEFLKDWEMGGADRLIDDYTKDETQAERENLKMAQGIPVEINDFDNDQAHVDAHQNWQKQQRYEQLQAMDKVLFEKHVQDHKQRIASQQQAQMQLEMQQQQGPPDPNAQAQGQMDMQGQQQQQAQQAQGAGLQQQIQAAQAQHDIATKGAQQGQQMHLSAAQQQQQMELARQQAMQQAQHQHESHQQKLRQAEEQHQAKLRQMAQQAKTRGGSNGRQ